MRLVNTQIKVIFWLNVDILLGFLFNQRWQMGLTQRKFARRTHVISNGRFDVGLTPFNEQAMHTPK